ncbi:MAG: glycosyltransferase family 2 protein [Nitrospirota bacterium]
MSTTPKVSVIIPVYNRVHCITDALESVLQQTYRNIEIIVIDDGSTDATREVLAPYRHKITYIYQDNAGPARARNNGIMRSSGAFIAFLDSDDLWSPEKIEQQVKAFMEDPQLGIVATNVMIRYPGNDVPTGFEAMDTATIRERFLDEFLMVTSSVMIRKACLEEVGLFNESLYYAEDLDLFYRVARRYHARILPAYLTVNKREKEKNLMTDPSKRARLVADTLACFETLFAYPENRTKTERRKNRLRTFYRWIGVSDLYANPKFARRYLMKALLLQPRDWRLYVPLLKSFVLPTAPYHYLKKVKMKVARDTTAAAV